MASKTVMELHALLREQGAELEQQELAEQRLTAVKAFRRRRKGRPIPDFLLGEPTPVFHVELSGETPTATTKVCGRCGGERPLVLFPLMRKLRSSGRRNPICQSCLDNKVRQVRLDYPGPGRAPRTVEQRTTSLLNSTRLRAWRLNVPFNLRKGWIGSRLLAGRCEVTGLAFSPPHGQGRDNFSASIDREIPAKGYTEENCRMVVWLYNAAKGAGTDKDVARMAEALIGKKARKKPASTVEPAGAWRMSKAGEKMIEGLNEALAFSKIDALWRRTKKKRNEGVSQYDWGYRDGVMAARALFGTEYIVEVPAKPARKRGKKRGKV